MAVAAEPGGCELPTPAPPWVLGVADRLFSRDREGRLPWVSSRVSAATARLAGGHAPTATSWRAAIEAVGTGYARALAELLAGQPASVRRPRVISLCTGYDAAAELVGLVEVLGPLSAYVSVDHDLAVVQINAELVREAGGHADQALFLHGDLRDQRFMASVLDAWGPFDLGLVVRPPILPTRCGDLRRTPVPGCWDRVDEPVLLALLGLLVDRALAPACALFLQAEREVAHVRAMLDGLGYGDVARTMTLGPGGVLGHGFLLT